MTEALTNPTALSNTITSDKMDNGTANGSANAVASSSNAQAASSMAPNVDMVGVLGNLLKSHVGDVSNERMAQILIQNMTALVQQGKLNQNQLLQV
jgi:transcription initiation factor TFIID subunit 12